MNYKVFPIIMIAANLLIMIVYIYQKDWRRSLYWFSSAAINISITF